MRLDERAVVSEIVFARFTTFVRAASVHPSDDTLHHENDGSG